MSNNTTRVETLHLYNPKNDKINRKSDKGFTFIELLLVLAILSLITTVVMNTFVDYRKNQSLQKDTETVTEVLERARIETISSQNAMQYGVHIANDKITLFTGPTYSSGDPLNRDFALAPTDTIVTISLTGGGSEVVFSRLSGETNQSGTVVLSSPSISKTKTVTIYKTGLVESQ